MAALALPVSAANAGTIPDNKLGWSSCLWPAGHTITVAVDPAFPFPTPDYSNRLNEAIVRWDGVLRTSRRGGDVVRVQDGPADIQIQYRALEGSDTSEVLMVTGTLNLDGLSIQKEVDVVCFPIGRFHIYAGKVLASAEILQAIIVHFYQVECQILALVIDMKLPVGALFAFRIDVCLDAG